MAQRFGISPFVIALVIVGFATSTLEQAVNLDAAIGPSIHNIPSIFGATALITPLPTAAPTLMGLDMPVMIACAAVLVPTQPCGKVA